MDDANMFEPHRQSGKLSTAEWTWKHVKQAEKVALLRLLLALS